MDRKPGYGDVQPVRHAVTYEEMQEAKVFCDSTSNEYGYLKARAKFEKLMLDSVKSRLKNQSEAKSDKRREEEAEAHDEYLGQLRVWYDIDVRWSQIEAKTRVEYTKVDIWRTISANERTREQAPDSTRERRY